MTAPGRLTARGVTQTTNSKLRLLYLLGDDFSGFSAAAAWEDTKVGLRHFTLFERIAVVTDIDWIANSVRALGFALPAEVKIYGTDAFDEAWLWISEPAARGSLEFELDQERGVLLMKPQDELKAEDFERVADEVDPYIRAKGDLSGVIIDAPEFPGWDDFLAFTAHMRFIREHRTHVRRIALVTNSRFLIALPTLARLFINAEIRHFDQENFADALEWVHSAAG